MAVAEFVCPPSMQEHVDKVMAGEYDIPGLEPRTILDIGANVGAFAVWAHQKWPKAFITCYEPDAENARMASDNLFPLNDVHLLRAAVCCGGRLHLHRGRNNCGERSLVLGPEQSETCTIVDGISPADIPPAEFLKIDTEGAELVILSGYTYMDQVKAVALEWHSARDRVALKAMLLHEGFSVSELPTNEFRGIMKAIR